jgi:hypothetical protein
MKKKRFNVPKEKWADEEIKKSEGILRRVHVHEPFFSKIVFWSAILVIVVGNLMMSIALIPFLAVLNRWFLDIIILVLGLVMGFLFNFLITNIGHLDRHHHILAGIILPIIAVVNVVFIVLIGNRMIEAIEIVNVRHNPWIIGVLYGAAFIFPYVYYRLRKVYK